MRLPLDWLREFTALPADATAEQVLAELVTVGFEEEAVHRPGAELRGPIVVGQVLSMEPEPQKNGKTINWCQVRVAPEGQPALEGEGIDPSGVQGIVCGAHNFAPGDKVIVTLPGAVLPGDFRISPRKTYGHVSAGMIASARELGLGEDHDGIIVLGRMGLDPEVGTDVFELFGLAEEAAEINVTPDRGYAFSLRGVAREYALATGTEAKDPADAVTPAPLDGSYPVTVRDDAPVYGVPGCDRFVARVVEGVDPTAPTPVWMARRLRLAGMRSISIAVDISNYVMLELGQPNHCYDADRIDGGITVRRATEGERLTTLDEKERTLSAGDLVVADDSGPLGIAGVMGGAASEVSSETTRILVEAAHFDRVSVARSRRAHKLSSEAAKRFERGVDPLLAPVAAQRVVDLLVELAGARDTGQGTDLVVTAEGPTTAAGATPASAARPEVRLGLEAASRRIGLEYTAEQQIGYLEALGCAVRRDSDALLVTPPSWRHDLATPEDLIEEIVRLGGFEDLPSTLPVAPPGRGLTKAQLHRRRVLQGLADAGLTEVLSYPFVSEAQNALFGSSGDGAAPAAIRLENPLSAEFSLMRRSILPGLVGVAQRNLARGFRDLALYEGGLVFLPRTGEKVGTSEIPPLGAMPDEQTLDALDAGLPPQPFHVAGIFVGHDVPAGAGVARRPVDVSDALDAARLVGDLLGVQLVPSRAHHHAFHPGRCAALALADGTHVGYAGELHPKVAASLDLPGRVAVFEVDVEAVSEAAPDVVVARPLSGHPATTQDVALVVAADALAGDVEGALREGAGELLESVDLFDVYEGPGVEEGHKSLAFAMRFRAQDRTLTADEASEARAAAVRVAAERFGAVQR
ncbi:phenylalanine--tRNA ligase subunit beta [Falsarthrobacter nasiphocae]|uniref:Phenylalanine--tRNA ligase beta subunit n=1 Tax=Falsarthrobacter nasiphocae TaxID=189863 RepID=A0AAE3YIC1_9MICC|nr:phenylalanine--tRNA ligase subunit beta [Falsarthrobacter nasiphocae]MDR6892699.1 phenylalanyl-tRNA synthetase beta chain [Falsarthrobacter nasiphocae]